MRNFQDGGRFGRGSSRSGGRSSGGFRGGNDARPQMHHATCSECGQSCDVPFKPSGERPVYCNDCFKRDKDFSSGGRSSKHFDARDFTGFGGHPRESGFDKPMYSATCAECGEKCEVPFRPTGEKPVYCRNCFRKDDGGFGKRENVGSKSSGEYKEEFKQLHIKLDSILRRLDALVVQKKSPRKNEAPEKASVALVLDAKPPVKKAEEKVVKKKGTKKADKKPASTAEKKGKEKEKKGKKSGK